MNRIPLALAATAASLTLLAGCGGSSTPADRKSVV